MVCDRFLQQLNGLRVLIVDSNIDSRVLLSVIFEEYGIETLFAVSASEALEIVKHVKLDLLISELCLTDENGYSLMARVKAFEMQTQVQIPTIALMMCAGDGDRAQALAHGFAGYLSKPFDIDELIETVVHLTLIKPVQTLLAQKVLPLPTSEPICTQIPIMTANMSKTIKLAGSNGSVQKSNALW